MDCLQLYSHLARDAGGDCAGPAAAVVPRVPVVPCTAEMYYLSLGVRSPAHPSGRGASCSCSLRTPAPPRSRGRGRSLPLPGFRWMYNLVSIT